MLVDILKGMSGIDDAAKPVYDFVTPILGQIKTLVPVVLPAVIGFIAFRKGWKFLRSSLRSA